MSEDDRTESLVELNRRVMDSIVARLQEKAQEQVRLAMELTDYCRVLVERDKLSCRVIGKALGVAHTSVFRAVEKRLPLNVVFAAARKIGHQHEVAAQARARAGVSE